MPLRIKKLIWFCLVLIPFQFETKAQDTLFIHTDNYDQPQFNLNPYVKFVKDSLEKLDVSQWMSGDFPSFSQKLDSPYRNLNAENVWWFQLHVTNEFEFAVEKMLVNHAFGMADVWLLDEHNQLLHWRSGRYVSANKKTLNIGDFIHIPLKFQPQTTYKLLIRAEEIDHQGIITSFRMYEPAYWYSRQLQNRSSPEIYRFFQGVFWIMIIYNLILFFRLSQRAYLYYSLYLLCVSGFVAFAVGSMTHPTYGDPRWLSPLGYLAFGGINVFYYQFGRQFLNLREMMPRWDRFLGYYVLVKVILLVLTQVQLYTYFSIPLALVVEFGMLLVDVILNIFFFVAILRQGNILGFYFVAGSGSVLVLGLSLAVFGYFFPNPWTFIFFLISIVIEMIFFSLGLSYRIRKNEREKLEAEKAKREAQEALNAELSKINTAFGRFVPHEFIKSLGYESILDINLGDSVEKEVTVLFSDIRGYTSLSENMSPADNFHFLNEYLGQMGPIIQANKGFVNQYYGDGIMALFLQNPEDGLKAGIQMLAKLKAYNLIRKSEGKKAIQIGIGLHTGPLMMGVIGDTLRLEAGVVSDTVNTAARMEGLTKFYHSQLLFSGQSYAGLKDVEKYDIRFLGKVQVKGKKEAVEVYECFSEDEVDIHQLKKTTQAQFDKALEHYFKGNFTEALHLLDELVEKFPYDEALKRYRKYSVKYLLEGTPIGWNGVESMKGK